MYYRPQDNVLPESVILAGEKYMRVSGLFRLAVASVLMFGFTAAANATPYVVTDTLTGTTDPQTLGISPAVGPGDTMTFTGDWPSANPTPACDPCTGSWYFSTSVPGLFLLDTTIGNAGFTDFTAQLFGPGNALIYTFTSGVLVPLISLASAGQYRLDVVVDLVTGHHHSYTFSTSVVPLPAAAWLLLSGVAGLGALARRRKVVAEA